MKMNGNKALLAAGAFAALIAVPLRAESEPIALVLSGGGAKGAYEVGVWQELQAAGIASRVAAISGTSVGAINAALFATRPEAAETLWLDNMEEVFTLNTNRVAESIQKTLDQTSDAIERYNEVKKSRMDAAARRLGTSVDALPAEEVEAAEKSALRSGVGNLLFSLLLRGASDYVEITQSDASREGYVDSAKLAAALDGAVPADWPAGAPAAYATAFEKGSDGRTATWKLNGEPQGRRILALRASAAIPVGFDTVEIDGKTYVDGGWESKGGDNVPLEPILEHHSEIKTVVIVYLDDAKHLNKKRFEKNRAAATAAGVRLVEIVPSENIGGAFGGWQGVFDASPETAKHLIELGRQDTRKKLREAGLVETHLDN